MILNNVAFFHGNFHDNSLVLQYNDILNGDLEKLNNIANKEVFDRNNFEQNRYFSNVKKKTAVQNTGNSKLI